MYICIYLDCKESGFKYRFTDKALAFLKSNDVHDINWQPNFVDKLHSTNDSYWVKDYLVSLINSTKSNNEKWQKIT